MRRFVSACLVMVVLLAGMCFAQCPQSEVATLDEPYVIGPLDNLSINVWKEPEVSGQVQVRPDGKISLPLLNDIEAAGNTPRQLADILTKRLKQYLTDPRVTVIVTAINSKRVRNCSRGEGSAPESNAPECKKNVLQFLIMQEVRSPFLKKNAPMPALDPPLKPPLWQLLNPRSTGPPYAAEF
jgi:hypothetical protein